MAILSVVLHNARFQARQITPADEQNAWVLWLARPDKTYSFTDCTSFVIMRRLGLQSAIAVDTDFQREGFLLLPPP